MNSLMIAAAALLGISAAQTAPTLVELNAYNPVQAVSLSASGAQITFDADGATARETESSGLSLTLTLKSGTPITVSF